MIALRRRSASLRRLAEAFATRHFGVRVHRVREPIPGVYEASNLFGETVMVVHAGICSEIWQVPGVDRFRVAVHDDGEPVFVFVGSDALWAAGWIPGLAEERFSGSRYLQRRYTNADELRHALLAVSAGVSSAA